MSHRPLVCIAILLLGGCGVAAAQTRGGASQDRLLKVNAALPMEIDPRQASMHLAGAFRVLIRVVAAVENEYPFTVLLRMGGTISGWDAYTSSGAQCQLFQGDVRGVDVFMGRFGNDAQTVQELDRERTTASSIASTGRTSIVGADFVCDQPIREGDTATIQIRFHVRSEGRWGARNYSFSDLPIQLRQRP